MTATFIANYWGKAHSASTDGPAWHPLAYHSLDVAAVADRLLSAAPRRLDCMTALAGAEPRALHRLLVALTALHDVGKFSNQFQAKSANGPKGALPTPPPRVRHDAIGFGMLTAEWSALDMALSAHFDPADTWRYDGAKLWAAVTGHHGQPALDAGPQWDRGFGAANKRDAAAFVRAVANLLPPDGMLPDLHSYAAVLSWHVAGLVNVADWIGSNEEWFTYAKPEDDLASYWERAKANAEIAVRAAGILPTASPGAVSAPRLLPHITGNLTPLQQTARDCALPDGPMLAIVEDVTGAGKTEAALLIAARLMAESHASGLFFALPTMATANAMYDRLSQSYRRLFEDDGTPSLVLAHGKRALHEGFRHSILESEEHQCPDEDAAGRIETPADLTASVACVAWIADDRRKAFLADVGVGTVDQALLGVLPTRFQSLRLWGLSDRVLIIDEAHSFDSYLSRELETLLEFHAALGGSAIVLSATLNATARNRILAAFNKGLGGKVDTPPTSDAYPLLTLAGRGSSNQHPVASRPESARELRVRRVADAEGAIDHVVAMSRRGACVAWIRNTVDDAIAAFEAVRARGCDPILLHARFAMGDRLCTEADVQRLLGKSSTPEQRHRRVLIGTQILEQSLDYDVDAMITDLAPVDMIIQRAGRLWRHPWRTGRPFGENERELLLLSPDPDGEITPTWYKDQSKGAAAVYSDHGYVWRSAKALIGRGVIDTPGGIRGLLSAVYDEGIAPDVPAGLERASLDADGKRKASRSLAAGNSLDVGLGYMGNNLAWQSDTVTPTRLGEPVTVFRLARREAGQVVPWHPLDDAGNSIARAWALSECAVRTRMAAGVPEAAGDLAREIADAKALWPTWEQDQPLLLLDEGDGGVWRGRVVAKDNTEREVLYDRMIGWRLAPA